MTIRELNEKNSKLLDELRRCEQQLKCSEELESQLLNAESKAKSNLLTWTADRTALEEKLKKLILDKESLTVETAELKELNTNLSRQLDEVDVGLESICKKQQQQIEQWRKVDDRRDDDDIRRPINLSSHNLANRNYHINLRLLDDAFQRHIDTCHSLSIQLSSLNAKLEQLEGEKKVLNATLVTRRREVEDVLKSQVEKMQEMETAHKIALEMNTEEIQRLKDELEMRISIADQKLSEANDQLATLEKTVVDSQSGSVILRSTVDKLKGDLTELNEKLTQTSSENGALIEHVCDGIYETFFIDTSYLFILSDPSL